jgi:hypothetical protein
MVNSKHRPRLRSNPPPTDADIAESIKSAEEEISWSEHDVDQSTSTSEES